MTVLTNKADLEKIRQSGRIIRNIFRKTRHMIRPGVTTAEIDRKIEEMIAESGAKPAFKGYKGYPAATCVSVNEVVVHGIPSERIVLAEGDIVSIDVGVEKNGFFADAAKTFFVGKVSSDAKRLVGVTKVSLAEGIRKAIAGNRVSDISRAIQDEIERAGYQEVRAFVGHGIGRQLHEAPEVPNWGEKGKGPKLKEGLVLAIEPMVNEGTREVNIMPDKWTAVTVDGKRSAHFEHTIIVGRKKAEIIT